MKPVEPLALLGPSGCGKSTLMMILDARRTEPRTVARRRPGARTTPRAETGIMFQDPTLLPWKSALDNVLFPFQAADRGAGPADPADRRGAAPPPLDQVGRAPPPSQSRASSRAPSASPSAAPWLTSPIFS